MPKVAGNWCLINIHPSSPNTLAARRVGFCDKLMVPLGRSQTRPKLTGRRMQSRERAQGEVGLKKESSSGIGQSRIEPGRREVHHVDDKGIALRVCLRSQGFA